MKQKILCMFLCVFLLMNLFVIDISASEVESVESWQDEEWEQILDFLSSQMGVVTSGNNAAKVGIGTWIYASQIESIKNMFNDFKAGVSVKNGKVLVSSQAMNALKGMTDAYIKDCGEYLLYKTSTFSDFPTGNLDSASYNYLNTQIQSHGLAYLSVYSNSQYHFVNSAICWFLEDVVFTLVSGGYPQVYVNDTDGYYYDVHSVTFSSNSSGFKITKEEDIEGMPAIYLYPQKANLPSSAANRVLVSNDGRYIKVFKSIITYRDYVRGTGKPIYLSTIYNNYNTNNDNSIEINNDVLIKYVFNDNSTLAQDLNQIVNNVTNVLNNYYVTNGTAMTQADIQAAIDAALQKFYDSLPSGGGTTDPDPDNPGGDVSGNDPTVSGNDVSGNGVDGPLTVGWLEKIYKKLVDIFDYLKGGLMDALEGIKGAITDIGDTVSNNSVSGNTPGTDPDVGDMMAGATEAATPAAELLKAKFPTCIPWDVINVFNVLVADPSPPVYEIPIDIPSAGVSETLTIDLSVYDTVFKISRSLITVLFALLLMRFTVSLTKGGDS